MGILTAEKSRRAVQGRNRRGERLFQSSPTPHNLWENQNVRLAPVEVRQVSIGTNLRTDLILHPGGRGFSRALK